MFSEIIVNFVKSDRNYDNWGIHFWYIDENSVIYNLTEWNKPILPEKSTDKTISFIIKVDKQTFDNRFFMIFHKGDEKSVDIELPNLYNFKKFLYNKDENSLESYKNE